MIPSRVTRDRVDTRIPWMLMQSTHSLLQKEEDHRVRAIGVLSAVEHMFNETAMQSKAQASNRMAKANRESHGPRVSPHSQAKARVKTTMENPKENPKEPKVRTKVPNAYTRAKVRTFRNLHRHVPLTLPGTMVGMVERWLEFR